MPCAYELEAPWGRFLFVNVHLETPRDGLLAVVRRQEDGGPELEANTRLRANSRPPSPPG